RFAVPANAQSIRKSANEALVRTTLPVTTWPARGSVTLTLAPVCAIIIGGGFASASAAAESAAPPTATATAARVDFKRIGPPSVVVSGELQPQTPSRMQH